ncbi:MAG: hypothetical protein KGQ42_00520, partial [Alphaproteobacteria bacterium]|nr:hypothetical protein [Alphaproteobacteria bacterium]
SDWHSIRPLLEMAGRRVGFDAPDCHLPDQAMTFAVVDTFAENPAVERAVSFGAQQLIHQHRGLWDLMQARQIARGND